MTSWRTETPKEADRLSELFSSITEAVSRLHVEAMHEGKRQARQRRTEEARTAAATGAAAIAATTRPARKSAVVYARVASGRVDEHQELEKQIAVCQRYANTLGATVRTVFADHGRSGSTIERPGLEKLRKHLIDVDVDFVICRDLARIGRDPDITQTVMREITTSGAALVCGGEPITIHTTASAHL